MSKTVKNNELKMLTQDEILDRGWVVPSFAQFSKNMEKRLKTVRGEETDDNTFLLRHNYKANSSNCQA